MNNERKSRDVRQKNIHFMNRVRATSRFYLQQAIKFLLTTPPAPKYHSRN